MPKTNKPITIPANSIYHIPAYTVPAGTEVELIKGADGLKGNLWAVKDHRLIAALTKDDHHAKVHYTFIENADNVDVEPIAGATSPLLAKATTP